MADDTWDIRVLPILEHLASIERGAGAITNIGEIADATGLDPDVVVLELERLIGGGYVDGDLAKLLTGGNVRPWTLAGVRSVTGWPMLPLAVRPPVSTSWRSSAASSNSRQ